MAQSMQKKKSSRYNNLSALDWIEKDGKLMQLKTTQFTLTEHRFLSAYLSKVNPRDPSTARVKFTLKSFCEIMGTKVNVSRLRESSEEYIKAQIVVPDESSSQGYKRFNLYDSFRVYKNEHGVWMVEITCSKSAEEYIFNLNGLYAKYQLGAISKIDSIYATRLAEMLYSFTYRYRSSNDEWPSFTLTLDELREYLGVPTNVSTGEPMFAEWRDFKRRVIDSSCATLKETGLYDFDYTPVRGGASGKKTVALSFVVRHLPKFEKLPDEDTEAEVERMTPVAQSFYQAFLSMDFPAKYIALMEKMYLSAELKKSNPDEFFKNLLEIYDAYECTHEIKSREGLLRSMMASELRKEDERQKLEEKLAAKRSFDLEEYEKYDIFAQYDLKNKEKEV